MYHFFNEKEFLQNAIDSVSRMTFDRACDIMQDGNSGQLQLDVLRELSWVAYYHQLSNSVINTYFDILAEEIAKERLFGEM